MDEKQSDLDVSTSILLVYGKILLESNYSATEIKEDLNKITSFMKISNYTFVVTENTLIIINSVDNDWI